MNLPLSYNYCKTNKIALINEDNKSVLHICGLINPSVLSAIQDLFLHDIEKQIHTDDEFENLLTELYTNQSDEYDFTLSLIHI